MLWMVYVVELPVSDFFQILLDFLTGMLRSDKAGIQFHMLNRSKGPAVWVRLLVHTCNNTSPSVISIGTSCTNRPKAV